MIRINVFETFLKTRKRFVTLFWVLYIVGCAPYGPTTLKVGSTEREVLRVMGEPNQIYQIAQGKRLEYARGPWGQETFMVDLDLKNEVRQIEQVLTKEKFQTIKIGQTTQTEVARTFGHPAEIGKVFNGDITWTYRYREVVWNQMYHIYFNAQGIVTRAHSGPDEWLDCNSQIKC